MSKKRKIGKLFQKFSGLATRKSSLNPYFRDKFQFRGKKVYYSKEYATEKSRARSQLLNLKLRALSRLKVKKADRGKLIFYKVAIERRTGKVVARVSRVRGKALLKTPVYVLKAGKKKFKVLNQYDAKTLAPGVKARPSAQRIDLFDIRRIRKRPIDFLQYLEKTDKLFRDRFIKRPLTKSTLNALKTRSAVDPREGYTWYTVGTPNGNLDPFYRSVISVWSRLVEGDRKQAKWRIVGRARLSNGKTIEFEPQPLDTSRFYELTSKGLSRAIGRSKRARRVYSTPFMYDLYSRYIHSGLAGALGTEGLVTQGSIRRIASKPYNKGKKKSEWKTTATDGQKIPWPGQNKEPIKILGITYRLKPSL